MIAPAVPTPLTSARPLRVLVVEDSLTIRKYLVSLLSRAGLNVVGEAADGLRAVALCRELMPDVITMDMILPQLSGLAATEQIMAFNPTPILIVSASVNRGEVFETYEALAAGAVDVFDKVRAGEASADWERRFLAAVRMVARIKVITHPRARLSGLYTSEPETAHSGTISSLTHPSGTRPSSARTADLIAIGASTGGPAALAEILRGLPASFPIPILIVLHISELFAFAFAEWLDSICVIKARYATDREPLPLPGRPQIILAPAGRHLAVEGKQLRLTDAPERNSCRPSIDILFETLATSGQRAMLCLLTGMGRDGAAGMLRGHQAGLHTIAQDEASSVIYGMPAEAVRLGAVDRVLSIQEIAAYLATIQPAARPAASGGTR